MLIRQIYLHLQQLELLALGVDGRTRQHRLDHVVDVGVWHVAHGVLQLVRGGGLGSLLIAVVVSQVPIKAYVTGALVLQLEVTLALGLAPQNQQSSMALSDELCVLLDEGRADVHVVGDIYNRVELGMLLTLFFIFVHHHEANVFNILKVLPLKYLKNS